MGSGAVAQERKRRREADPGAGFKIHGCEVWILPPTALARDGHPRSIRPSRRPRQPAAHSRAP